MLYTMSQIFSLLFTDHLFVYVQQLIYGPRSQCMESTLYIIFMCG